MIHLFLRIGEKYYFESDINVGHCLISIMHEGKKGKEISDMCHRSDEPIYITKNGYGDMVIMGMEVYGETMHQLAVYRDIEVSENQIEIRHAKGRIRMVREATKEDLQ